HNILVHNSDDGTFTDVTRKAGVYDEQIRWGAGCTWLDYDRDGRLDLFVCNYIKLDPEKTPSKTDPPQCQWKGVPVMCGPRGLTGDTNVLFHNNGDGTFTDVSAKSGILKPGPRYSITAVSYDFDNDGWPDIYVAVDSEPSILFHNNHDGTFTDVAVIAGCAYSENGHEQAGMGVAVADYDCDGWFDIFKTNFADDTCNLYHNNGDGTFTDVTFASGVGVNNQYVAWGCAFLDYDNDGWADIMQINRHVYPQIQGHSQRHRRARPRRHRHSRPDGRSPLRRQRHVPIRPPPPLRPRQIHRHRPHRSKMAHHPKNRALHENPRQPNPNHQRGRWHRHLDKALTKIASTRATVPKLDLSCSCRGRLPSVARRLEGLAEFYDNSLSSGLCSGNISPTGGD